jgi:hypothetical protein
MDAKISKDIEILEKYTHREMLEMKFSINQIKHTVENITNRPGQSKERMSGNEDKVEEILHSDKSKEKKQG